MPLTRKELSTLPCSDPDCPNQTDGIHPHHDGMYLHSLCHPEESMDAYYRRGILTMFCHACTKPVVQILVAEK